MTGSAAVGRKVVLADLVAGTFGNSQSATGSIEDTVPASARMSSAGSDCIPRTPADACPAGSRWESEQLTAVRSFGLAVNCEESLRCASGAVLAMQTGWTRHWASTIRSLVEAAKALAASAVSSGAMANKCSAG